MHSLTRLSMLAPVLLTAAIGLAAYGQASASANTSASRDVQGQSGSTLNTVKTTVADSAITTDVKAKLLANPGTKGFDIHVETNHGVVTLHGTVRSTAEKELAEQLAMSADGVKAVTNDLKVEEKSSSL
ncbi:MAG: BON domain-containing protein [Gammaproteobacteria bacterium]